MLSNDVIIKINCSAGHVVSENDRRWPMGHGLESLVYVISEKETLE